jgi:hypothetical protein
VGGTPIPFQAEGPLLGEGRPGEWGEQWGSNPRYQGSQPWALTSFAMLTRDRVAQRARIVNRAGLIVKRGLTVGGRRKGDGSPHAMRSQLTRKAANPRMTLSAVRGDVRSG